MSDSSKALPPRYLGHAHPISQPSYAVPAHLDAPSRSTGKLLEPTENVKGAEENQHPRINGLLPHASSRNRDGAEATTSVDFS